MRLKITPLAFCIAAAACSQSQAAVPLYEENGWNASVSGSFPVFLVNTDVKDGEKATRVMSGFNPANLTFGVTAPKEEGLVISGKMQINNHLQGSQTQNSGLWESRVAEIQIDGDFGTVNIGKGFGIFNSSAIGDTGSGLGVGLIGGNVSDGANATAGRIGTGYVYANFNPRIMYSHSLDSGLSYKVGLFNPEEPTNATANDAESPMPRLEGQVNFAMEGMEFWAGFMHQSVNLETDDADYTIQGYDVGARVKQGPFGATLAYTITKGIGADGLYGFGGKEDAEVDGTQWYVEGTYTLNKTLYGASYGEGAQDENNDPFTVAEQTNSLTMLFAHHRVTSHLRTMFEYHTYKSESGSTTLMEYSAVIVGTQLDF